MPFANRQLVNNRNNDDNRKVAQMHKTSFIETLLVDIFSFDKSYIQLCC